MNVEIKCFSSLVDPGTCDFRDTQIYALTEGSTVEDLAKIAGVDRKNVKIAFVNGRIVGFDTILADGDRVGLAPAVGGM